jgi:nucleotide-binding universal stress UspA family protein
MLTKYPYTTVHRAETERLAAERLLEEAKALIEDARVRVDKDETEVNRVKMVHILSKHKAQTRRD